MTFKGHSGYCKPRGRQYFVWYAVSICHRMSATLKSAGLGHFGS